jgi:hypothetical protein
MEAQWEQRADRAREALIEDPDRPSLLDVFIAFLRIELNDEK